MKNIDKIFNESLKNYERQPRTEAWKKLQARLEKKHSKVLPLWWKYASVASIALILSVGGYWFLNNSSNENLIVAITNRIKSQPVVKSKPEALYEIKKQDNVIAKTVNQKQKTLSPVSENFRQTKFSSHSHVRKSVQDIISPLAGVPTNPQLRKQIQDSKISNKSIITLETIKTKTLLEENTIVLVLENTKPKKEEETIILNIVETKPEVIAQNLEPEKKQSRVGKIWEQLKRAKNGENVNWGEMGVKPQKVLARADAKIENVLTRGESNDK